MPKNIRKENCKSGKHEYKTIYSTEMSDGRTTGIKWCIYCGALRHERGMDNRVSHYTRHLPQILGDENI